MRYILLLLSLAICAVVAMFAANENKIKIVTYNGEITEYQTSEVREVSFSDAQMAIVKTDGGTNVYYVDDIEIVEGIQGLGAIDLGLSVKWASMNIGAEKPADYGDYYAWGETETKGGYSEYNSKWYRVSIETLKSKGVIDANGNLTPQYDAATVNWGAKWRMPTTNEFKELMDKCTWKWTKRSGKNGYNVIGPNGNSIFIPAEDINVSRGVDPPGTNGHYWCATVEGSSGSWGSSFYFYYQSKPTCGEDYRYEGKVIRPVTE